MRKAAKGPADLNRTWIFDNDPLEWMSHSRGRDTDSYINIYVHVLQLERKKKGRVNKREEE